MVIGEKARALYLFSFVIRALYILLAMWDDFYAAQGWDGSLTAIASRSYTYGVKICFSWLGCKNKALD